MGSLSTQPHRHVGTQQCGDTRATYITHTHGSYAVRVARSNAHRGHVIRSPMYPTLLRCWELEDDVKSLDVRAHTMDVCTKVRCFTEGRAANSVPRVTPSRFTFDGSFDETERRSRGNGVIEKSNHGKINEAGNVVSNTTRRKKPSMVRHLIAGRIKAAVIALAQHAQTLTPA